MSPYPGMQLALGSFFNALLAGPQVEAPFAHEGLGDAQLAFPEGFSGLPAPVRPLHERGQAEGVFPADAPFGIAYVTVVSCLVAMVIFAPRFAGLAEPGLETDPARFRDKIIGQLMNGMTGYPGKSSHHPPAMQ